MFGVLNQGRPFPDTKNGDIKRSLFKILYIQPPVKLEFPF